MHHFDIKALNWHATFFLQVSRWGLVGGPARPSLGRKKRPHHRRAARTARKSKATEENAQAIRYTHLAATGTATPFKRGWAALQRNFYVNMNLFTCTWPPLALLPLLHGAGPLYREKLLCKHELVYMPIWNLNAHHPGLLGSLRCFIPRLGCFFPGSRNVGMLG